MSESGFVPSRRPSVPGQAITDVAAMLSATGHAGTYRRTLPVALARLYENALDWEHLPWVHPGSFRSIECLGITADSWQARTVSGTGRASVIELALDRDSRRWITRVLEGEGQGNEIWTHAFPIGERRVDIVVDFFLPGVPAAKRDAAGAAYARLYAQLYDEDVAMMVERMRQLERRQGLDPRLPRKPGQDPGATTLELGAGSRARLPLTVTLLGREFRVVDTAGAVRAFPAQCPHQLGPLDEGMVTDGVVICPWHGDRFDLATGRNLGGRLCELRPLPVVHEGPGGALTLVLAPTGDLA